MAYLQLPK